MAVDGTLWMWETAAGACRRSLSISNQPVGIGTAVRHRNNRDVSQKLTRQIDTGRAVIRTREPCRDAMELASCWFELRYRADFVRAVVVRAILVRVVHERAALLRAERVRSERVRSERVRAALDRQMLQRKRFNGAALVHNRDWSDSDWSDGDWPDGGRTARSQQMHCDLSDDWLSRSFLTR